MIGLWWWLAGCPRPAPVESAPPVAAPEPEAERTTIIGPRYWTEPGGLCLEIPDGFSGLAGEPPTILDLTQETTGFGLQLRAWPLDGPVPARPGYTVLFEDPAGYRTVPILGRDAGSRTWLSDDAEGRTITSWFAPLGDRMVEVSIVAPPGHATEARAALDPLVHALCTTWLAD